LKSLVVTNTWRWSDNGLRRVVVIRNARMVGMMGIARRMRKMRMGSDLLAAHAICSS
jgi:hypothetical protein